MKKWSIVFKAFIITIALVAVKYLMHKFNIEFIQLNMLISSFISGVVFTIAVVFSGVLADFKESEKIPGELAASLKALHKDFAFSASYAKEDTKAAEDELKELVSVISGQFETKQWKQSRINEVIERIDILVVRISETKVPPAFIARMRGELNNIEKISNRIDTIEETSFLPAAYAVSETAIVLVIFVLFFAAVDPYILGMFMFFTVSFLLVSMMTLIKDMDNPFDGNAAVDLSHVYKLKKYLEDKGGNNG